MGTGTAITVGFAMRGLFVTLLCGDLAQSQTAALQVSHSGCGNSTIEDAWGPEFGKRARLFFDRLRSELAAGDRNGMSLLMHYPLQVFVGEKRVEVSNRNEFLRRYPKSHYSRDKDGCRQAGSSMPFCE